MHIDSNNNDYNNICNNNNNNTRNNNKKTDNGGNTDNNNNNHSSKGYNVYTNRIGPRTDQRGTPSGRYLGQHIELDI